MANQTLIEVIFRLDRLSKSFEALNLSTAEHMFVDTPHNWI